MYFSIWEMAEHNKLVFDLREISKEMGSTSFDTNDAEITLSHISRDIKALLFFTD